MALRAATWRLRAKKEVYSLAVRTKKERIDKAKIIALKKEKITPITLLRRNQTYEVK